MSWQDYLTGSRISYLSHKYFKLNRFTTELFHSPQSCSSSAFLTFVNSSTISLLPKPEARDHLPSHIPSHLLSHSVLSILPPEVQPAWPIHPILTSMAVPQLSITSLQTQAGSSNSGHCLKCKPNHACALSSPFPPKLQLPEPSLF